MHIDAAGAWLILGACTLLVILFLAFEESSPLKKENSLFQARVWATTIWGGALAFFLPIALDLGFGPNDDGRVLRQLLLYTTGGVLGVITLNETRRKNDLERSKFDKQNSQFTEQLEAQKEQIISQSEKDMRDHIRQVHAERRSRYTKAIEQLADDKGSIRLGGVYSLVGLVDEWLADENISSEDQKKEGQVIINNLCAYIRSPFPLAKEWRIFKTNKIPKNYKGNFISNQAKFYEEQDVRKTILNEIENRLRNEYAGVQTDTDRDDRGPWSDFKYDFRGATFFYSVNFMSCHFGKWTSFANSKFIDSVSFHKSTFTSWAGFYNIRFESSAYFWGTSFIGSTNFSGSSFAQYADFSGSSFKNIQGTTDSVDFTKVKFKSANFSSALFQKSVCFREASFKDFALFYRTRFVQQATFNGTTFNKSVSFEGSTFNNTPPTFSGYIEEFEYISKFSNKVNPDKYNFNVSSGSIHSIELGTAELDGKKFMIPMGSLLFSPRSWDNKTQKYTHTSDPAKRIEDSGKEEKPSSS